MGSSLFMVRTQDFVVAFGSLRPEHDLGLRYFPTYHRLQKAWNALLCCPAKKARDEGDAADQSIHFLVRLHHWLARVWMPLQYCDSSSGFDVESVQND